MPETWTELDVTWDIEDIGAYLMDSIGSAQYSREEVLREYVQNAVDSYADFKQLSGRSPEDTVQVWVDTDNHALQIMDNGVGMDRSDLNIAKAIAVSPKIAHPTDFVGFRGLGIWAGLGACDRIVLTTTKVGVPKLYRLTIDCKGIMDHCTEAISIDRVLHRRLTIEESEHDPEDHFTHVKLVDVHTDSHPQLLDVEAVTTYVERHLPVPFDPSWPYANQVERLLTDVEWSRNYHLTVNNAPVYRRFPPKGAIKAPERHSILADGREVAVAWLCETARRGSPKVLDRGGAKGPVRNFAVRIKNFAVGERGLYADSSIGDVQYLDWYVGKSTLLIRRFCRTLSALASSQVAATVWS